MHSDIQIAEHLCTQLPYNSTEGYTATLKRIWMHWKNIMDKRVIIRPSTSMGLDFVWIQTLPAYVDLELTKIQPLCSSKLVIC